MLKVSYDEFFAFLYKNNISKSQLAHKAGISRNSIIKMAKGELVHTSVIIAICEAYNFSVEDVMKFVEEKDKK